MKASVLYIDSPVGSGYSYVTDSDGYATNEKTIGAELYTALYTFFFELHTEYSALEFYIFGESYAGMPFPPHSATTRTTLSLTTQYNAAQQNTTPQTVLLYFKGNMYHG